MVTEREYGELVEQFHNVMDAIILSGEQAVQYIKSGEPLIAQAIILRTVANCRVIQSALNIKEGGQ